MAVVGLVLGLIVPAGYGAILYPVFARTRYKAVQTSCLSNLKQLDLAMLMYCQDYDEQFPAADEWPGNTLPYCKNASVYVCPSDSRYTMNQSISSAELRHIPFPAETVSLYEGTTLSGDMTSPAVRHNAGLNVGFVDGHCKWLTATGFPPPSYRGR
jgi:prepilin-type processing-associated H-X9-DG protein